MYNLKIISECMCVSVESKIRKKIPDWPICTCVDLSSRD